MPCRVPVFALVLVGWADALAPSSSSAACACAMADAPAQAKAAVLGLAIAATAGFAPNSFAGDAEVLESPARLPNTGRVDAGANIFSSNCAACHAGGNNVIQGEKTLRAEALKEYLAGGMKESSVVTQVRLRSRLPVSRFAQFVVTHAEESGAYGRLP